jgi:hypothetical protein
MEDLVRCDAFNAPELVYCDRAKGHTGRHCGIQATSREKVSWTNDNPPQRWWNRLASAVGNAIGNAKFDQ